MKYNNIQIETLETERLEINKKIYKYHKRKIIIKEVTFLFNFK